MTLTRLASNRCAVLFIAAGLLTMNQASAADKSLGNCQAIQLVVALAPDQPANETISATYCQPHTRVSGPQQIDILTNGATFNSSYWDWPQDPALYSYVDKTLQAGRAAFNYDRVGTGASSHPPSTTVTMTVEAFVLHQIVNWAKTQGYSQINLIGHSYGSMITLQEAGTYQDASRVVITGLLHTPNTGAGLPLVIASLYPAVLDPEFAGSGFDAGYLTTEPGTRGMLFYSSAADPSVIAFDESHKDVIATGFTMDMPTTYAVLPPLNASDRITAPVLTIVGQLDANFCTAPGALDCSSDSSVTLLEAPYFMSALSFTGKVVPDTGHALALHPSAMTSFEIINQWLTTH